MLREWEGSGEWRGEGGGWRSLEENRDGVGEAGWGGIEVWYVVVQRALNCSERMGRDGEKEGSTKCGYGP